MSALALRECGSPGNRWPDDNSFGLAWRCYLFISVHFTQPPTALASLATLWTQSKHLYCCYYLLVFNQKNSPLPMGKIYALNCGSPDKGGRETILSQVEQVLGAKSGRRFYDNKVRNNGRLERTWSAASPQGELT